MSQEGCVRESGAIFEGRSVQSGRPLYFQRPRGGSVGGCEAPIAREERAEDRAGRVTHSPCICRPNPPSSISSEGRRNYPDSGRRRRFPTPPLRAPRICGVAPEASP